jgi:hypothetical protein
MIDNKSKFKDFHNSYDEFVLNPVKYVEKFTPINTMVDLGIQTKKRWSNKHEKEVIVSLIDGTMTSQFHIVDVNQCLDWAIKENNLFDVEYFNDLKNKGYGYLSIDGNHRTQLLWNYPSVNDFWKSKFRILLYKRLTLDEISEQAKRLNKGVAWNLIELRNNKSKVSNYIRKNSDEFSNLLNRFAGEDIKELKRFREQEILESFLLLHSQYVDKQKFNTNNKSKETIRNVDIDDSLLNNNTVVIQIFNTLLSTHLENYDRFYQMFYVMLYIKSIDFLEKNKRLPSEIEVKSIVYKFNKICNDIKHDTTLSGPKGLFDLTVRKSWDKLTNRYEYIKNHF